MSNDAPIKVSQLSHTFGKGELSKQILFDISTEIPRGEIVIVTGPSGSGKSTMLTLVGGLRSAQQGSVQVLGEELCGAKPQTLEKVRKQIGFIFQQHNLLGALTAVQNVELGLGVSGKFSRKELRERAEKMLEEVGLGERLHHKPEQLSGGQRQRVAIARALVSEPSMLLADEPTASLDKKSGRDVVERMKALAKEKGTTILLVTHDNRILDIADRIVHLEDGRLSTYTEHVIETNRHLMHALANNHNNHPIDELVAQLDEQGFKELLHEIAEDSHRFKEATELAHDVAFKGMLQKGLSAFTQKLAHLMVADKAVLWIIENESLVLKVAENVDLSTEIKIPLSSGVAGAVARTGNPIRLNDAYADDRFSTHVDLKTGYKTKTILCLPVKNEAGEVCAIIQLLNRKNNKLFNAEDELKAMEFVDSIGIIVDTLESITPINGNKDLG